MIRPLHVQVATLWLKGNGPKKIGENLSIDERSARRILGELRESARAARKYVQELSRIGYYQKIFNFKQIAAAGHLSQYERVKEGFWPYSDKLVPLGYRVGENRHIEESPEVGPALRRVWKRMLSGETVAEAARAEKIDRAGIHRILRNPMFWMGYVRSPDGYVEGVHKVLLDKATYDKIQTMRPGSGTGKLAFGFRREGGETTVNESQKNMVQQVFQLRREGKPGREIAEKLKLNYSLVYRVLHDPRYKPWVGPLWKSAQQVQNYPQERRGARNRARVLACLPATSSEVMEKTGFAWLTVWNHLNKLRKNGIVEREKGQHGRWHQVTTTS